MEPGALTLKHSDKECGARLEFTIIVLTVIILHYKQLLSFSAMSSLLNHYFISSDLSPQVKTTGPMEPPLSPLMNRQKLPLPV